MSDLALKCIRENIEKHRRGEDARSLDLGNCGITEVPSQIGECTWLEELILSDEYWYWDGKKWQGHKSQNTGRSNNVTQLPDTLAKLKNL